VWNVDPEVKETNADNMGWYECGGTKNLELQNR
jgi:hypothetical protein